MPDRVPTSIQNWIFGYVLYIRGITPRKKMGLKKVPIEQELIQILLPEKPNLSLDKIAHNTVLFGIFP